MKKIALLILVFFIYINHSCTNNEYDINNLIGTWEIVNEPNLNYCSFEDSLFYFGIPVKSSKYSISNDLLIVEPTSNKNLNIFEDTFLIKSNNGKFRILELNERECKLLNLSNSDNHKIFYFQNDTIYLRKLAKKNKVFYTHIAFLSWKSLSFDKGSYIEIDNKGKVLLEEELETKTYSILQLNPKELDYLNQLINRVEWKNLKKHYETVHTDPMQFQILLETNNAKYYSYIECDEELNNEIKALLTKLFNLSNFNTFPKQKMDTINFELRKYIEIEYNKYIDSLFYEMENERKNIKRKQNR